MMDVQVYHYDAFTTIPNQGNPAGVVIQADHFSKEDMQENQGGINYGIDTCWYNPKQKKNESIIKPTYEIHHLEELLHYV